MQEDARRVAVAGEIAELDPFRLARRAVQREHTGRALPQRVGVRQRRVRLANRRFDRGGRLVNPGLHLGLGRIVPLGLVGLRHAGLEPVEVLLQAADPARVGLAADLLRQGRVDPVNLLGHLADGGRVALGGLGDLRHLACDFVGLLRQGAGGGIGGHAVLGLVSRRHLAADLVRRLRQAAVRRIVAGRLQSGHVRAGDVGHKPLRRTAIRRPVVDLEVHAAAGFPGRTGEPPCGGHPPIVQWCRRFRFDKPLICVSAGQMRVPDTSM